MMRWLILFLLTLFLIGCAGSPYPIIVTPDFSKLTPEPTPDAAEERGKGSFITCFTLLTEFVGWPSRNASSFCTLMVQVMNENDRLGRSIPGWQWPPPTLIPLPTRTPMVIPTPTLVPGTSL